MKAFDLCGRVAVVTGGNAGVNIRNQPQEYTVDEWRRVMDTSLRVPLRTS